ncbi:MAG TPA: right-handed parallel beta-helix repeat-containing protein [Bradyrhizobium sp.]|nr:right-handed parallel beta-helix repeat-containing protein [Bradyrhizobium sp.]
MIRGTGQVGIALAAMTGGTNMVSIENTHSTDNLYGLASGGGNQIKITRSVFSGNAVAGIEADGGAQVGVEHSTVNFNGTGLQANGTIWIDDTEISFNQSATEGVPISFGNNRFYSNVNPPGALAAGPASTDRGQN